jgi:hypothetical protein
MVDLADLKVDPEKVPSAEVKALRQILSEFAGVNPSTVLRPDLGNELNFSALQEAFDELRELVNHLRTLPLDLLTPHLADVAKAQLQNLRPQFQAVQQFSLRTSQRAPTAARDQVANTFVSETRNAISNLLPIIGYLGSFSYASTPSVIQDVTEEAQGAMKEMKRMVAEMEVIVEAARKASADVSVARHAQHFSDEAKKHGGSAGAWLWVVGLSGASTVALAVIQWILVWRHHDAMNASQSAQVIFSKALVFSVIISATVWCGRVYKAYRHNEIVNRHRANALSSFEALAEGTDDAATKNAVLIQATTSIFSPQPSGFSDADSESAGPSQLIELVRNIPPGHTR